MRAILLALCLTLLGGCLEADLGEVPLLCNPGQPRCPKGYRCQESQGTEYCVKEGVALQGQDGGPARSAD